MLIHHTGNSQDGFISTRLNSQKNINKKAGRRGRLHIKSTTDESSVLQIRSGSVEDVATEHDRIRQTTKPQQHKIVSQLFTQNLLRIIACHRETAIRESTFISITRCDQWTFPMSQPLLPLSVVFWDYEREKQTNGTGCLLFVTFYYLRTVVRSGF